MEYGGVSGFDEDAFVRGEVPDGPGALPGWPQYEW